MLIIKGIFALLFTITGVLLIFSSLFSKDIEVLVVPWGTGRALQREEEGGGADRSSASCLQGNLDKLRNSSDLLC